MGAGPGAADLVTLRGLEALRAADVVVHDRLVPPAVLALIPDGVELVCIDRGDVADGDPGGTTGELLVRLAATGRRVVRLKGGDPTVFARLAEELAPLRRAGVAVEIVPGVTAAVAAAAAAGIPLTSRDAASSLTLVTGHEARGKDQPIDLGSLAVLPGTLAVYMGVEQIGTWSRQLIAAGRPPDTPVAIVCRASWPDQQVATSTLEACAADAQRCGWKSPALLIVGEVAAHLGVRGPLAGSRVIVTRPAGQEGELVSRIRALGGLPLHVPVVRIVDPPDWAPLDAAIRALDTYDWVVFASVNGVRGFLARLRSAGRDGRALGTARLAAIGPATRRELEQAGYVCDRVPDEHRSEGLLGAFADQPAAGRFLLVRATAGRDVLTRGLRAGGHHVDEVAAYASEPVARLDEAATAATADLGSAWITITSGIIAESAARLFGSRLRDWRIASISPVTSAVLRRFGLEPTVEAATPGVESLVDAMVLHEQGARTRTAGEPSGSAQGVQTPQAATTPAAAAGQAG
ncbi:MAG: uroporphyrinogen-III C-methyltransferase [Planctomycetota bacterium]